MGMGWFNNLSVRLRLTASFGLLLAFLVGLMAFSLWSLRASFQHAQGMFDEQLSPIAQLSQGVRRHQKLTHLRHEN